MINPRFEQQFAYRTYDHISRWYFLDQTVEVTDGVSVVTDYEYDEALGRHTKPTKITLTNSDGKKHQTRMTYIPESADATNATSIAMQERYMISQPIESRKYVQQVGSNTWDFQGGVQIEYAHFQPMGTSQYFPTKYSRILSDNTTLEQLQLHNYTAEGFLETSSKRGFPIRTYTWENSFLKTVEYGDWQEHFTYKPNSRLRESHIAIDGQVIHYTYDGYQRLKTTKARDGAILSTYNYDLLHDLARNPSATENQLSSTVTYSDAPTQTSIQTFDGLGRQRNTLLNGVLKNEVLYDELGRIAQKTYLPGNLSTLEYDNSPLNRSTKEIYPDGSFRTMDYDAEGNYFKQSTTDENGHTTYTLTDILGRTHKSVNADGEETSYLYEDDRLNQPTKIIPPMGDDPLYTYHYTYDSRNRLDTKTIPGGGTTTYTYYKETDLPKTQTDANGNVLTFYQDTYGRDDYTDLKPAGQTSTITIFDNTYDEGGGINIGKLTTEVTKNLTTGDSYTSNHTYDEFGRLSATSKNNHGGGNDEYVFTYNHADWTLAQDRKHNTSTDSYDIGMGYTYDDFGRVEKMIHAIDQVARVLSESSWNNRDQLVRKVIGNGLQSVDYTYNNRGWLTSINQPLTTMYPSVKDCAPTMRPENEEQILELLDAEKYCGQATTDISDFLNSRFDPTYNFDCYNPCELTGGVQGDLNCTPSEISAQLASFQDALAEMRMEHATATEQACADGSTIIRYSPHTTQLNLPTRIYRLQLCDKSEVHVLEDQLAQLSGEYIILYSTEISTTSQIITVKNTAGINRYMSVEGVLGLLLEEDPEELYLEDYQRNTGPCEPIPFDCNDAEQTDQNQAFAAIQNAALNQTPQDFTYPARFSRVLLCDGTEAYLHSEELEDLTGSYSVLQELVLDNAATEISYGNTFTSLDKEDLFYLGLHYESPESSFATSQQNGNIAWIDWQVSGAVRKAYTFEYDDIDRLKDANYHVLTSANTFTAKQTYNTNYVYDKNGNIETLQRWAPDLSNVGCAIGLDDLAMTYTGNQLISVIDNSDKNKGFLDLTTGLDYTYDLNGNNIFDPNKNATITYNYLNLPQQIAIGTNNIYYEYDAAGTKLSKRTTGSHVNKKNYFDGMEYGGSEGLDLEAIYHNEGRVVKNGGDWEYQYYLQDHLGNNRVVFKDDGSGQAEVVQESHFYPFGMTMDGSWTQSNTAEPDNNYLYNGKELQDDFGLGWYDYGARMYDPTIARFTGVDLLAENHYNLNSYHYVMNNPLIYTDPFGLDTLAIHRSQALSDKGDKNTNVYDITFSLIQNGVSSPILDDEGNELSMLMIANKKSEDKEGNALTEEAYNLVFQTRGKHINEDGSIEEGYENEIYFKESGGRGKFIHSGKNAGWYDGCMGVCNGLNNDNPVNIDIQDSRDALSSIRNLYDKHKSGLTGEKFIIKPNSSSKGKVSKASRQVSSFFQSLFNKK